MGLTSQRAKQQTLLHHLLKTILQVGQEPLQTCATVRNTSIKIKSVSLRDLLMVKPVMRVAKSCRLALLNVHINLLAS